MGMQASMVPGAGGWGGGGHVVGADREMLSMKTSFLVGMVRCGMDTERIVGCGMNTEGMVSHGAAGSSCLHGVAGNSC